MGLWKYRSCCHGDVCHSDKHISLYQHVIYWFHIMGEWFRIVEHFGSFLLCNVVIRREWNSGFNRGTFVRVSFYHRAFASSRRF